MRAVTVYTKPGCPYCTAAKDDLQQRGIQYTEHNVQADRAALRRMLELNGNRRLDALQGDASLFSRGDEIELSWALIDDILVSWEQPSASPLVIYEPQSWGPEEAEQLLSRQGRRWYQDCGLHHAERRL